MIKYETALSIDGSNLGILSILNQLKGSIKNQQIQWKKTKARFIEKPRLSMNYRGLLHPAFMYKH